MKRRSVKRVLALASCLFMLSGEVMPVFAQDGAQAEETAAEEESEEATGTDSVSEDEAVSENEAVSEDEAVSENMISEDTEEEKTNENDGSDEEVPEEDILTADESVFTWDGDTILKYTGTSGTVVIPQRARVIGEGAFSDNTAVTRITFEKQENVKEIGEKAFYGCSGLKDFDIPSGVSTIGAFSFCGCSSITEITLPDNVLFNSQRIGNGRGHFEGCSSLKKVKNVTGGIEVKGTNYHPVFNGCTSLTEIEFGKDATKVPYELFSGCVALKAVKIPASIHTIDFGAFSNCSSLTTVSFEAADKLVTIGEEAFRGCSSLKDFDIPPSVKSIGGFAFADCASITEITLPKDVVFEAQRIGNGRGYFEGCKALKKVKNVTGGIEVKGTNYHPVFNNCTALTEIEFADGATRVPYELFSGCVSLKSVQIPSSVNTIDFGAFSGCTSLTTASFEAGNKLVTIGEEAFRGCSSLTGFEIPSTVKTIGAFAFADCSSITEITLPKDVVLSSQRIGNGRGHFENCKSLKVVKNVTGGIVVKGTEYHPTFNGCTSLTEIQFASGIKKIPGALFSKCVSLRSVTIPNSVTTIDKNAFDGCTALSEIHLPAKLKSVKESAFRDCVSITEVYYGGKSTREKIRKASEKNNDPLFEVEWIKENRSDAAKTGELVVKSGSTEVKADSLKEAFGMIDDPEKFYVIELKSDLKGEKNLTVPKTAKQVRIMGNGYTIEICGGKITSNTLFIMENVKIRTVNKKGEPVKLTVNAKKGLIINIGVSFDTKSTTVRTGEGIDVNGTLEAQNISCARLSLVGTVVAVKGCRISIKKRLIGAGGQFRLTEGFNPIKLGGVADGKVSFTGERQADGTQIMKASAKKIDNEHLKMIFNVTGISMNKATTPTYLLYYGGKVCIFGESISYNGNNYAVWKDAVAAMNKDLKAAKKEKAAIIFTVNINDNVNMMGKFLLPAKGYESITIYGNGNSMKFTSDIKLTGNTTISGATLLKVNKKGVQVSGKVKKGKFDYEGPETF